jgi:hypothetical protein
MNLSRPVSARRQRALRRSAGLRRRCVQCQADAPAATVALGESCLDCRRWSALFTKLQAIDDGVVLSRFCLHC